VAGRPAHIRLSHHKGSSTFLAQLGRFLDVASGLAAGLVEITETIAAYTDRPVR
jgi:hypothetical protein